MSKHVTRMEIGDALHYTPAQREAMIADWPEHERAARARGIPHLGAGAVFPLSEKHLAQVRIDRLTHIPRHWYRIGGIDFGWEHPTAAVELHHDRDYDVVYVTRCYGLSHTPPEEHAIVLRSWGKNLRFAWPADGLNETAAGRGHSLRDQYRAAGLKMLEEHAHYEVHVNDKVHKDTSVEAGVLEMLDRMRSDRFKVYDEFTDWWTEFFSYHRDEKTGKIVKKMDDRLCATRYALMMLRHARQPKYARPGQTERRPSNFDT